MSTRLRRTTSSSFSRPPARLDLPAGLGFGIAPVIVYYITTYSIV